MNPDTNRELILGPAQPTLEAALADKIRAAKTDDPGAPVVVLVGSNMLAIYLRRRLAEEMALWNVRFLTFAEIARKLGSGRLRALGRKPLPELAGHFIVRNVIQKLPKGYFDPVADRPGFVRTAVASIQDLKEAGLGPDALDRIKDPKLATFKMIFEGYQKALEKLNAHDPADLMAAAAETVPESDFITSSTLIAYGFYDLNGLQRRLLLALASQAKSATAMVPAVDAPAYEYAKPLVEWFAEHGFTECAAEQGGNLLTARLFAPPAGEPSDSGGFRILSVPGESREVREIVRQVLEFAAQGIPFHEIAVLLRNPDAYSRPLRDALEARRIQCFTSGGAPLADEREARSLQMLAELLTGELPRADVMQFVHFAPIAFQELLGHTPNTSDWDLLSIAAGIVEGPKEWTRRLAWLEKRSDDDENEHTLPIHELPHLKAFIDTLIEAKKSVAEGTSWKGTVDALLDAYERMIERSEIRDRVSAEVGKLRQLDDLGIEATFDDVRDAITDLLQRSGMPSKGFQRGKVYIGDLFASRGLRFRAVIIPGLVEKSFPSAGRQDPILLDRERAVISQKAGAGAYLPAKSARPAEERMLFALALASASERTTLTFSRLDVAAGRERVPSHFLTRLVEALTGRRCDYSTLETAPGFSRVPMFPAARKQQDLDPDEYDLHKIADLVGSGKPARALYLADVSAQFKRGIGAETARWQEKCFTKYDGIVSNAAHKTIAGEVMSPTRIEEYAGCPFAYFLRHVLGIEPLEEPERIERITPLDRGALIHRVFFSAYAKCFRKKRAPSAEKLAAALRESAETAFRRPGAFGPALTWGIDRAEMLADLDRFAALDTAECQAADARPAMFETRFGMPQRSGGEDEASTEKPLELRFGGKTYKFKGKIDRIDEAGANGARIIDYKTGKKNGKPNAFQGGRALQLPIYILAAQMLRPERKVMGAAYLFATRRGGFGSVEFTREELETRMDDLEKIVVTVESGIENGVFVALCGERCRYCECKDACGANQDVIFERKKGDPAIAGLLEMMEIK